jgi:predicted nuclease of predicted toxin-antitoxin system
MRFLVDENAGTTLALWLRNEGHEVFSVYAESRGIDDDEVIQKAFAENWILITSDKDFGEKVYREQQPHHGIVLLRLSDERAACKIITLKKLLEDYSELLPDSFVVVTEKQVRFAKASS